MTTEKFEEYQVLHTVIFNLKRWTIHAATNHLTPITQNSLLPHKLSKEIHEVILEMAEKHLAELEKKFELI